MQTTGPETAPECTCPECLLAVWVRDRPAAIALAARRRGQTGLLERSTPPPPR